LRSPTGTSRALARNASAIATVIATTLTHPEVMGTIVLWNPFPVVRNLSVMRKVPGLIKTTQRSDPTLNSNLNGRNIRGPPSEKI
jgi:hypothetical protein